MQSKLCSISPVQDQLTWLVILPYMAHPFAYNTDNCHAMQETGNVSLHSLQTVQAYSSDGKLICFELDQECRLA